MFAQWLERGAVREAGSSRVITHRAAGLATQTTAATIREDCIKQCGKIFPIVCVNLPGSGSPAQESRYCIRSHTNKQMDSNVVFQFFHNQVLQGRTWFIRRSRLENKKGMWKEGQRSLQECHRHVCYHIFAHTNTHKYVYVWATHTQVFGKILIFQLSRVFVKNCLLKKTFSVMGLISILYRGKILPCVCVCGLTELHLWLDCRSGVCTICPVLVHFDHVIVKYASLLFMYPPLSFVWVCVCVYGTLCCTLVWLWKFRRRAL